jgi:hypothetical protein
VFHVPKILTNDNNLSLFLGKLTNETAKKSESTKQDRSKEVEAIIVQTPHTKGLQLCVSLLASMTAAKLDQPLIKLSLNR